MPVSNRTIAATGVAATIVAAVLASYLTDYLDRAQPAVFVTAVGFGPSLGGQPVEVTDDVISLSGKIDFVPSLKRYESYDKLINYDAKISEIKQELTKALDSLDSWQKLYSTSSLTRGSVEAHPLLANGGVFEECFLRSIENNDIDAPVSNLDLQDDLKHKLPLFDMNESVEEGDTRFIVWKSMGTVEIGVPKIMPEHKRQLIEQYVNSIIDGNLKNLMYYSGNAASRAQTDLSELSSLQDKLRKIIEPASALRAELYFYNNGQRAVTIRPYFGLKVLHSSFKDKIFVLAVTSENKDGNDKSDVISKGTSINKSQEGGGRNAEEERGGRNAEEEEGKDVMVARYLPSGSDSQYINLTPGNAVIVDASGIAQLGGDAAILEEILRTGLLNFEILALTADGRELWSEEASFSDKVGEEQTKDITKRIFGH